MERTKRTVAQIARIITEMKERGSQSPVADAAKKICKWTSLSQDEVYLIARAAGYRVFKRNGEWFEKTAIDL